MTETKLTLRQRAIVPISAFTATGDLTSLTSSLAAGLDAGLTISEIKEVLVQLYAYLGFPRALNGLGTFMTLVNERKAAGIADNEGVDASPLPADKTRLALGTEVQTTLVGAPVKAPIFDFAPAIDAFLKDHLFGDIFGRDNLGYQDREIATLGALAALDGVESQFISHLGIAMNTGLTVTHIREVIDVLATRVSPAIAQRAKQALDKRLASQA